MCTVTYIPTGKDSFILTQNRDEHFSRPHATPPQQYEINSHKLVFPKDPTGGGTWICASNDRVVCLLNGAFAPHIFCPPYKKSRGIILLESFDYFHADDFLNRFDFSDIEPFTMIWVQKKPTDGRVFIGTKHHWEIFEMKWDGTNKHILRHVAEGAYIWSSATLYNEAMEQKRSSWFEEWLKNKIHKIPEDVLKFHHEAGDGDLRTNIMMNRGDIISTVSVSCVIVNSAEQKFLYEDVQKKENSEVTIKLSL